MRTHIAMLGMLAILEIAVAEENYSQWSKYRPISINTTSSGANVAGTVSNFPVLVRLTSAYADVFTQTLSGGADIRFTDSTGTVRLPHQKERWDTAAQVAEFWVLVPSIAGNASTGIRLYWGKSGVADSSNGSRVFSTGNDFRAVWHLNEPSGDISDVTDNAFAGINNGTVSAASQIGMGRSFNGTTSNYIRIDKSGRDDGGANTNNAKASLLDSLLTTFTVSTWFNATSWGSTVSKLICRGSSTIKYAFQGTNPGLLFNQNATTSGPKTTSDPATGWHLVHGTYSGGTANFFMDGVLVASRTGGSRATDCSPYELMIGARNTSTAYPPTSVAEPFHGLLDEIRIQGAPRSTDWIKLELIGDDYTLQPDTLNLPTAADKLIKQGFKVLPYCTEDLVLCQRLVDVGCQAVMPWAAPIGTGKGPLNAYAMRTLRERLNVPMIVDAGLGLPSHACTVMEWGYDAVLLNTAVALANDPVHMAEAFANAVKAGRSAFLSGAMQAHESAQPSTPTLGTPFWHHA